MMKRSAYGSFFLGMLAFMGLCSFPEDLSAANKIQFTQETLGNGLHVIYNIDRSAPIVSTALHYKVGSKDEDTQRTGFAHFFEHLMFEATDHMKKGDIDKIINEAGGELNAHTSFDETVYKFTVPSNEIKLALWIEASRMRNLQVAEKGVETQRGVVKEERRVRYDNQPYGTLLEEVTVRLFDGSSYSWTTIGSLEHLDKAQISEFKDFYDRFYQPNNAVLVISGDFDLNETKKYVKEYMGSIPKGPDPKRNSFAAKPINGTVTATIEDEKAQLPLVVVAYRSAKLGDPDSYAMDILTTILAAGESSRMYQELVNKKQVAIQAQISPVTLQMSGAAMLVGLPTPGKDIKEVEEGMYEVIDGVIEKGVTDEELLKAKNIVEVQYASANKNTLDKAMSLARYYAYYGDAGMINNEIEKYMKVTKEDIKRVAKKYLGTDDKVVLYFMPKGAK